MKFLEIPAILRPASKYDLFTGNLDNLHSYQYIKDCTTIFVKSKITGQISGPKMIYTENDFSELYIQMLLGMISVLSPVPEVMTTEEPFRLILRLATIDDFLFTPYVMKYNRLYYKYTDNCVTGPFFTNTWTTREEIETQIKTNKIYVPNERQHFKRNQD